MPGSCEDLTIHDLLNDPLTQMVMRADRVDPLTLRQMLGSVALEIERADRQADYQPRWQNAPLAVADGGPGLGQWLRSQLCGAC
jgi:hypothetical protein